MRKKQIDVLIIGSGGREHALAYACSRSSQNPKVYCAPGNGGTAKIAQNIPIKENEHNKLLDFIRDNQVNLTIIGPEAPLAYGLGDKIRGIGFNVFGPGKDGAKIEESKAFAKQVMKQTGVPTADFETFDTVEKAVEYLNECSYPVVIKASGLAAGKGVIISNSFEEAQVTVQDMLSGQRFGDAGKLVVIEEFLDGRELSLIAMVDGEDYLLLSPSRDHKKAYDNDEGPNTGGMGAYAPVEDLNSKQIAEIAEQIFPPVIRYFKENDIDYKGCLYAGLIDSKNGMKVLEFNCRFGDPETQAILPLLEIDALELMQAVANGSLRTFMDKHGLNSTDYKKICMDEHVITIVAAAQGYPGGYKKGFVIKNLPPDTDDVIIFHAGTKYDNQNLATSGGRVLAVTARSKSLERASAKAYETMYEVNFDGIWFRNDIGKKL